MGAGFSDVVHFQMDSDGIIKLRPGFTLASKEEAKGSGLYGERQNLVKIQIVNAMEKFWARYNELVKIW